MEKKAVIVVTTFMTRVVVDETTSSEQMAELVKPKLIEQINNGEIHENIDLVMDDTNHPYGTMQFTVCPVCQSENIREDFDYPETMMCCDTCGADVLKDGEVVLNPKETV